MKIPLLSVVFFCLVVLCSSVRVEGVDVNIGVLYGEDDIGNIGLKCMQIALSDFYNSVGQHYDTRIILHPKLYPKDTALAAPSAALYLLKYSEVKAIIMGPTTPIEAEFVIQLGEKTQVPIVSYSTTNPSLKSSYLIHVAQKDSLQVKAISALMQAFQWREVIPIFQDMYCDSGFIPYLDDALQQIGARIPFYDDVPFSATDEQLVQLLRKLKTKQTRVFLVHMSPELASRLFLQASQLKMMDEGYAWIVTTSISNGLGSLNQSVIEAMQGVIGVKTYVQETTELKQFQGRWERKFRDVKLNVMGLWAYDAASALERAVEEVAAPNSAFKRTNVSKNGTDLDSLGVSTVGPDLLQALQNTSFRGLSGNFSLSDGQLIGSSTFKVVNVLDSGSRDIGFWTPENGLTRKLNMKGNNHPSSSANLRPVIWPGETTSAPKGWEIPANGKKLRVGVPVKHYYLQLVNATQPKITKGFCIDIFESIMENLGYSGHYEYHPFEHPDGTKAEYDELVHQVSLQNFDIAVGDITILSKRATEVDFTLPYTESGVTMVVPIKNDRQSAWVFLKPLTWDLWVTILSTFIIMALVIWVIEHRINEDFRGPPLHQLGTSLFYSFSMMVFAHRENVFSNLTRLVVIVWAFVVLVLTQSYTASLSSLLTVQQLQPTITSVDELLRTGAYVGVQEGTFVKELLIQKGFQEAKLITYRSTEDLDKLLSAGSNNGGIDAVLDEIPYMKLFLANYSSKYIMNPPIYKTDGFGFALPKGSPLVPEISREILKLIEGDKMVNCERNWGMQLYNGTDQGNQITSGSVISLDNVWGLFLIVAVSTGFSLIVFTVEFFYKRREIWMNSEASVWSIIKRLTKAFEQRDMAAHTFRQTELQIVRNLETDQTCIDGDASRETLITPPRLSSYSDRTEESLAIPVATTPSPEPDSLPTLH